MMQWGQGAGQDSNGPRQRGYSHRRTGKSRWRPNRGLFTKVNPSSIQRQVNRVSNYQTFMCSFEYQIEGKTKSQEDCLQYLLQYTDGKAHELISPCVFMSPQDGFQKVKALLELEYGSKFRIATAFRKDLQEWPTMKGDPEKIKDFSILLSRSATTMKELKSEPLLRDPGFLIKMTSKLLASCQAKWRRRVQNIEDTPGRKVDFGDLTTFVQGVANEWNHPVFSLKSLSLESRGLA